MKLGLTCQYPDEPALRALPRYRDMGLDEVDVLMARPEQGVDTALKAFVDRARDAGVPAGSVSPRWGWIGRALKDPAEMGHLRAFIEAAPAFGTKRVMLSCTMASLTSDAERREHLDRVARTYREISAVAADVGIDLCTHTSAQKGDHLFGTVHGIDSFLDAVGNERNKLLTCFGCLSVAGWPVPQLVRHWQGAIGAVHVFNPSGGRGQYAEMRFDAGQLDVPAAIQALADIGYTGVIIPHEYPAFAGPAGKEISDGWAVGYLRALVQAATTATPASN